MSNFFKKIREAIASFSKSSKKEVESFDSTFSPEYKPVPRKNVRSVTLDDIPALKEIDKGIEQQFRKRENAVSCEVPTQLMHHSVNKKRITEKKSRNNKPAKVSEKRQ
jgi:hypothetical protein